MNAISPAALPEWNLADLYDGPQSAAFAEDLDRGEAEERALSPPTTRASSPASMAPASPGRSRTTRA